MKINPFSLTRPPMIVEEKQFEDPGQPGQLLTLKLKQLDNAEQAHALELGESIALEFLGSDQDEELKPTRSPLFVDGTVIKGSRFLYRNVAVIWAMQVVDNEDDRYTTDQLLALSVTMPIAWRQVIAWSNTLGKSGEKTKND